MIPQLQSLADQKPFLEFRGRLLSCIRHYFDSHQYLEVETPIWIDAPAPEATIEAPGVMGGGFLRTSPELQMKIMLAAGYENIYQIGSCFRENERGRKHNPEFTLLEWYQAGETYDGILHFTAELLHSLGEAFPENKYDLSSYDTLTVKQAFRQYADADPSECLRNGTFEEILVIAVEPNLGKSRPLFLTDYPAEAAAFARINPKDPTVSERWELYLDGVELANAYGELTDPLIQRERFLEFDALRRASGGKPYPQPIGFLQAIDSGIPSAGGAALGIDRLVMLLADAPNLATVRLFV